MLEGIRVRVVVVSVGLVWLFAAGLGLGLMVDDWGTYQLRFTVLGKVSWRV